MATHEAAGSQLALRALGAVHADPDARRRFDRVVVSSPLMLGPDSLPAGWHPAPGGGGGLRYWDGQQWTEHHAPGGAAPAGANSFVIGAKRSASLMGIT